jgi:hypothetical protein
MSHRLLPLVFASALVAGCGAVGAPSGAPRAASQAAALGAGAHVTGTQALAAFERMPSLGRPKPQAAPITIPPVMDPRPFAPDSILKIQNLAQAGLVEADKKENWNDRYGCTDAALKTIDGVKLATHGLNNVPAKVGICGAKAYGYIGLPPTHENRYKVQAVTLSFLRQAGEEAVLAKGSPIFTMAADMLEATTGWDQGFRVGISVLSTLKENYKDREISKQCQAILDRSVSADTKEEAYGLMVTGLREIAQKLR